ncbi:Ion transport 2 domain protein [Acidithiobacillus ferrivorans SS3]|uniref:Ion transport 2 domain protein n=1 Tax=Acidithiobacillus ferrivorans SS3 TaxID=743299 RepID=G0JRF9_9PROT|nr:voltage-gated potassium channel protein [Acidithiobacillus ferrivorans]AEM46464.1 Ion transport 2 domain protein [Acidithiobacillus ferrivorans SS3]
MIRIPDVLKLSLRQRFFRFVAKAPVILHLDVWFPQIPMAVAVGLLGVLAILDALPRLIQLFPELADLTPSTSLTQAPLLSVLGTVPEAVAGFVLLLMAFGLLFRSRFAWAITLVLAAAMLAILLHHYGVMWSGVIIFNAVILVALLLFRRHFARSSVAAGTLFAAISILLLMSYAVLGSYVLGAGFSPPIKNLVSALYFAVVTMSTVGYGDIVPTSEDARLFVISIIILGITVFATSISAVVVPLVNGRMQRLLMGERKRAHRNHYLIIGDNALAQNTYRALRSRHLPALVLVPVTPEHVWMTKEDLMIGDATDLDVLRKAGAECALGVLALRVVDSENAFIILAAKELAIPGKTVAAVQNGKNLERLRQIGVDLIISPEVLGGELLALTLSGEELAGDTIISKLFTAKAEGAEA